MSQICYLTVTPIWIYKTQLMKFLEFSICCLTDPLNNFLFSLQVCECWILLAYKHVSVVLYSKHCKRYLTCEPN